MVIDYLVAPSWRLAENAVNSRLGNDSLLRTTSIIHENNLMIAVFGPKIVAINFLTCVSHVISITACGTHWASTSIDDKTAMTHTATATSTARCLQAVGIAIELLQKSFHGKDLQGDPPGS